MIDLLDVQHRYMEPHRFYHNLIHVAKMFETAKLNNIPLSIEQELAIWYHDVIYQVKRGEFSNEELSARYAIEKIFHYCANAHIENYKRDERIEKVATIIRDTENEIPTIEESKVVIDLDLWGLGTYEYQKNSILIEKEFTTVMTIDEFKSGRKKWLQLFLARDTIFVSKYANDTLEYNAVEQLSNDLDKLIEEGY